MTTLADRLDEIPHRRIQLAEEELSIWGAAYAGDQYGQVVLMHTAIVGQPARFTHLTPTEARRLGNLLIRVADEVSHIRGQVAADEVKAEGGSVRDQVYAQITACFAGV